MDELDRCNDIVGRDHKRVFKASKHSNSSRKSSIGKDVSKTIRYFPFKQGNPFVATLRVGSEGIQMTVDGKHITSFAYREVISFISYSSHLIYQTIISIFLLICFPE